MNEQEIEMFQKLSALVGQPVVIWDDRNRRLLDGLLRTRGLGWQVRNGYKVIQFATVDVCEIQKSVFVDATHIELHPFNALPQQKEVQRD